jgi:hypothetical protein
MNVIEGTKRMQRAGRWMVIIALGLCVLMLCWTAISFLLPSYVHGYGVSDLILLLFFVAVPGAVLWLAGWILEGFAKEAH